MNSIVKAAQRNGWVILEDNEQYQNRIEISGSTGNKYIVAQRKSNSQWSCGCFGFRRHRHCKHLDSMMPALLSITNKQIEEVS